MPAWVRNDENARAEWQRQADVLRREQRLSVSFGPFLEKLASAYTNWQRWRKLAADAPDYVLIEKTRADGSHYEDIKIHPAHVEERQTREAYRRALNDGALSPATHSRARAIGTPAASASETRKARLLKLVANG